MYPEKPKNTPALPEETAEALMLFFEYVATPQELALHLTRFREEAIVIAAKHNKDIMHRQWLIKGGTILRRLCEALDRKTAQMNIRQLEKQKL